MHIEDGGTVTIQILPQLQDLSMAHIDVIPTCDSNKDHEDDDLFTHGSCPQVFRILENQFSRVSGQAYKDKICFPLQTVIFLYVGGD